MEKLDNRCEANVIVAAVGACACSQQHDQRPQALAAGVDDVAPDLLYHVDAGRQLFGYQFVDAGEVFRNEREDGLEPHSRGIRRGGSGGG